MNTSIPDLWPAEISVTDEQALEIWKNTLIRREEMLDWLGRENLHFHLFDVAQVELAKAEIAHRSDLMDRGEAWRPMEAAVR